MKLALDLSSVIYINPRIIDNYELGICFCGNCKVSQTFFTISIMFLTKVLSFYCSPEHAANNSVYKNTNYSPQRTIREKSLKPIIRFTLAVISNTYQA